MKKVVSRRALYSFAALLLTLTAMGLSSPKASAVTAGTCHTVELPVALAHGQPNNQTLKGTLCEPTTWAAGDHQVDILVHGATYNRGYWDFPVSFPQYSYVERTLSAGRATFAYDRLGAGTSSRPLLAASLTPQGDAYNVKQISQWLRTAKGYTQVNAVGHSMGSIVLMITAGTYPNELNRVVLTGLLHATTTSAFLTLPQFTPALLDPQFSGSGIIDPTYLTTAPGGRAALFYNSTVDPAVLAYDEAHKDVVSSPHLGASIASIVVPPLLNVTQGVTAPVLTVVGDQDFIGCTGLGSVNCTSDAAIYANEAPYFSNAASLTAVHIDNTGHNLTLHPTAGTSFAIINQWLQTH